jgi:hypothetical protein
LVILHATPSSSDNEGWKQAATIVETYEHADGRTDSWCKRDGSSDVFSATANDGIRCHIRTNVSPNCGAATRMRMVYLGEILARAFRLFALS